MAETLLGGHTLLEKTTEALSEKEESHEESTKKKNI
ncbi:hypothetical protein QG37_06314 [Candidozyma auris]|uniref:Uncharacterized protein n=1 Tax=Candidozyma auris TaxID=498019 RepID=A0A0L0NSY1_CANAR|nr:hypothetical protein QG37_06314 [[Candida] auris]